MAKEADGAGGPVNTLTIEQVAAGAGIPVSTVRMYQHRGLLAPPEKRGRVGYYGPDHEARLRLIAELQERGFSLAAIHELVQGWERGRSLDDVLGLGAGADLWVAEEPVVLDVADLVSRFSTDVITPELLTRTVELGLAELTDDGRVRVFNPSFLEVGARLSALGVGGDEVIDEYEALRAATAAIAERFTDVFVRHVWEPAAAEGITPESAAAISTALDELGRLAQAVVERTLAQAIQERARAFLDEQAAVLAGGVTPTRSPKAPKPAKKAKAKAKAKGSGRPR